MLRFKFTSLNKTGYLDQVNATLSKQQLPPIRPCFVQGFSRTHFTEASRLPHFWVGLLPEGEDIDLMISVDPSFQEISNTDNNGYSVHKRDVDPLSKSITSKSIPIALGSYKDGMYNMPTSGVIGISSDREIVFTLGFIKSDAGEIHPAIVGMLQSGISEDEPVCLITNNGDIAYARDDCLSEAQRAEMKHILETMRKIKIVKNHRKAQNLLKKTTKVSFRNYL